MKNTIQKVAKQLKRLHECEGGAEGLEKLLIVAALILPLLAVLIFFGEAIRDWLMGSWTEVQQDSQGLGDDPGF